MGNQAPELNIPELSASLAGRLARAYVDSIRPRSRTLRRALVEAFNPEGGAQPLLASPLIQHKFGYDGADQTVADLQNDGLLNRDLVDALDAPRDETRFPRDRRPYQHQLKAWRAIIEKKQSTILAAGTGSGKTEGFLVPILNDLYAQARNQRRPIEGVQALMLYPLNALIASQKKRLAAWTAASRGMIRYCLYNGLTPPEPERTGARGGEEVADRQTLRNSPPPILVTNATMLEYMLLRPADLPILARSQGSLRYVVLDEAHTYTGTQAAEIALLIRRVLIAFGVDRRDVIFIATSATFGGGGEGTLRQFISGLAGQSELQVDAVEGGPGVPTLPEPSSPDWPDLASLVEQSPAGRFRTLCRSAPAQALRQRLVAQALTLEDIRADGLHAASAPTTAHAWLELLQAAAEAREFGAVEPFLPFRAHFFARTLPGLWTCANPTCPGRPGLGDPSSDWPFGRVYFRGRARCSDCEHLVFPLTQCGGCRSAYLDCVEHLGKAGLEVRAAPDSVFGEFADDDDDHDNEPGARDGDDDVDGDGDPDGHSPPPEQPSPTRRGSGIFLYRRLDHVGIRLTAAEQASRTRALDTRTGALLSGDVDILSSRPTDPRPGCVVCGHELDRFQRPFLSAPFALSVLTPTLVAALPPKDRPAGLPAGGRRLLTFTDSRQGAAWNAARRQLDAELQSLRGVVYERLWADVKPLPAAERRELERQAAEFETSLQSPLPPQIIDFVREGLRKIQSRLADPMPAPVSWSELCEHLAAHGEIGRIYDRRVDQYPSYRDTVDKRRNAHILLLREFARAPRAERTLESMGLARLVYPLTGVAPSEWLRLNGKPEDWPSFVSFCLDLICRRNDAVKMLMDVDVRWLGRRSFVRSVLGPGTTRKTKANAEVHWPASVRRSQATIAKLFRRAFRFEDDVPEDHLSFAAECLQRAWDQVIGARLLESIGDDRYQLNMERCQLVALGRAWQCPATQRLFSATLAGYSPYSVILPGASAQCASVSVPRPPQKSSLRGDVTDDDHRRAKASWVQTDPGLQGLMLAGQWSESANRVLVGDSYLVSAEHTAQIRREELEKSERLFDQGFINILGSTTTLEMGIDLQGLTAVAMTNVPPMPANFLQRAGRAGRRGEAIAASLTLCRAQPHDQRVFEQPTWVFRSVAGPTVRLDSRVVAARHVNALLLGTALQGQNVTRLNCESFFEPRGGSLCEMIAAAWSGASHLMPTEFARPPSIAALVSGTPLGSLDVGEMAVEAASSLLDAAGKYFATLVPIIQEIDKTQSKLGPAAKGPVSGNERDAALADLLRQRDRTQREFLLSFLINSRFLPAHGFPCDVISFNPLNIEALKARRQSDTKVGGFGRIDNRLQGPSRPRHQAIQEYAPGARLVIKGLVHESRGVSLNWQRPQPQVDGTAEIQALRWYVRCAVCEWSGDQSGKPAACPNPECGAERPSAFRYLEPAGFCVDIREKPANDLSTRVYPARPREFADLKFQVISWLAETVGTRYVADAELMLLQGPRAMYSVCLVCGRVDPQSEEVGDGEPRKSHRPLRGSVDREPRKECYGDARNGSIIDDLFLGARRLTSVLEVRLRPSPNAPMSGPIATALAFAVRESAVFHLGVEAREIGVIAPREKGAAGGEWAIQLYDAADGGAGVCGRVNAEKMAVFRGARSFLECSKCDSVCHYCLLGYDSQHYKFDRQGALVYFDAALAQALANDPDVHANGTA